MILDLQHISETPMHNFKGGDGMVYTRMYSDDLNRRRIQEAFTLFSLS